MPKLSRLALELLRAAADNGGQILELPRSFGETWPPISAGTIRGAGREHTSALRTLESAGFVKCGATTHGLTTFELTADGFAAAKSAAGRGSRAKGGRPRLSNAEAKGRNALLQKWDTAKAAGVRQKVFCEEHGIRLRYLQRSVNWRRQRENRSGGA